MKISFGKAYLLTNFNTNFYDFKCIQISILAVA